MEDERARRDREREGEKRQGGSEDEGEWVLFVRGGGTRCWTADLWSLVYAMMTMLVGQPAPLIAVSIADLLFPSSFLSSLQP